MTQPLLIDSEVYGQLLQTYDDFIFKNSILLNKLWEYDTCKLISDLIVDGTEFVDIGANTGLISLGVQKLLKENFKNVKKYHCFEPNHINFSMLNYNTNIHQNMFLYNFAIADKFSLCNMTFTGINSGAAYIHKLHGDSTDYSSEYQKSWRDNDNVLPKKENNIFIPSLPLDFIIDIFENVSVIKIDVEGFEIQVLKGAEKFLNKFKPAIAIEIFPCNFEKCNELLIIYGYKLIAYLGKEDYLYQYTS